MDVTSLAPPAGGDIRHAGDEEQHGERDEQDIQHGGYHTPVLLPMTHTAPTNAVFWRSRASLAP